MLRINIRELGAECGGALQTDIIQRAIDMCCKNGGGEVIVPRGDFYTGSVRLRSGVNLHLEEGAHLIASRDPEDYMGILKDELEPLTDKDMTDTLWLPVGKRKNYDHMNVAGSRWNNAIVRAVDAVNISVTGERGSYIDGRDCFDALGEENYRGPHALNFHRCKNIKLSGYEIRNSANWAHALFDCENISVDRIKVIAGHDGIHLTSCKNITVDNCELYTGDDCIAGIDNSDVKVRNCTLNTACSAFRFGGRDVYIGNCNIFGPAKYLFRGSLSYEEKKEGKRADVSHRYNMLSVYTYYADFSREIAEPQGNVLIENCKVKDTDRLIHYNFSGNEPWQKNRPLDSIALKNIEAEGIKYPLTVYGAKEEPVTVGISNLKISFKDGAGSFMNLCHYKKVVLNNVYICNIKTGPVIKKWSDDGTVVLNNFNTDLKNAEAEGMAEDEFSCTPI